MKPMNSVETANDLNFERTKTVPQTVIDEDSTSMSAVETMEPTSSEAENNSQVESSVEEMVFDKKHGTFYVKGKILGKGGFGKCYLFRHGTSDHVCAGKCVEKASLKKERWRRTLATEIKIHKSLSHRNIVRFEQFFEDRSFVYILLEFCDSQTLLELVNRKKHLREPEAKFILSQLLDGVEYLKSKHIIHRDLKLGNIFLTNGMEVRIGDFGLATKLEDSDKRKLTFCGTPNYIAPEVLDRKCGYSFEVDIWCIGVILYAMLVGVPPFETKTAQLTFKRISATKYSFPAGVSLSPQARALIRAILNKDPAVRPSINSIRAHPFLVSGKGLRDLRISSPRSPFTSPLPSSKSNRSVQSVQSALSPKSAFSSPRAGKVAAKATAPGVPDDKENAAHAINRRRRTQPLGSIDGSSAMQDRQNGLGLDARGIKSFSKQSTLRESPSNSQPRSELSQRRKAGSTEECTIPAETTNALASPDTLEHVLVEKWVDYTSKYGLGYLLSSGIIGVYFNDSTKLVLAPDRLHVQYYERSSSDYISCTLQDYPVSLQKKITLVQHFRTYLEGYSCGNKIAKDSIGRSPKPANMLSADASDSKVSGSKIKWNPDEPLPFVKKWVRTRHAIFFRLSNRTVQVAFFDETQVLLSAECKALTFFDKKHNAKKILIAEAKTYPDIYKRLKYTKDVLHQLVSATTPNP